MKQIYFTLICVAFTINLSAQNVSDGRYALPENLVALPTKQPKSFPGVASDSQFRDEFKKPPKGYGNVPFYWWSGDKLTKEKLRHQLDILKDSPLDGFAVSYIHTHPRADKEFNAGGFGFFGRTEAGSPEIFSKEWLDIWKWFAAECAKEDIGVGLDDYTFGWEGNGYYPDEIKALDKMKNYQGQLVIDKDTLKEGQKYILKNSPARLSCVAWKLNPEPGDKAVEINDSWSVPKGEWVVYDISTKVNHMLHPEHGQELVNRYFQRIEDAMTPEERKGSNYYFQDELVVPLNNLTWSEDFAQIFKTQKGYDVIPYLAALTGDIGVKTEKVRLDYADVLTELAERRYFKPIFEWHWSRGLIYGADNNSRGMNPIEYVDYFRANRWFTAPGNDAPARGSSLIQTKVSSSISHLYKRPRTWLEAFHSMGWASSGEWLTSQLDHHLIGGGNLLCLHGLYYSTRGGWWEWAPPDFHFRMPYWDHMKYWLEYGERMTYMLSQGVHACDVALIYPTEAMQGVTGKSGDQAFNIARKLFYSALDFDFMDYQSVARSEIDNGVLKVSDENYKVLILADLPSVHHSTLLKAVEHFRKGGIVIATGELPYASTLNGRSPEVDKLVKELFGVTAEELKNGKTPVVQTSCNGGKGIYSTVDEISNEIPKYIVPDFVGGGDSKVQHRKVGGRDIYMVMNVAPSTPMFFRATGKVELWDGMSGESREISVQKQDKSGTTIQFDNKYERSYIIVFSEGTPKFADYNADKHNSITKEYPVDGVWEVEQVHTMDNSFGDFRMPVRESIIGAEARTFRSSVIDASTPKTWTKKDFDDSSWKTDIYGFGTQFMEGYASEELYEDFVSNVKANSISWKPYAFSWQFGVWENPGNQGYHGLKGRVDDGFFIMEESGHYAYKTGVYSPETGKYKVLSTGMHPTETYINGEICNSSVVTLKKGWHDLLVMYKDVKKGESAFSYEVFDERARGAVVLIPESANEPIKHDQYSEKLSMKWEDVDGRLKFDPCKGANSEYGFRFTAAPGLESMEVSVYDTELNVWIDGVQVSKSSIKLMSTDNSGLRNYKVTLPQRNISTSVVALKIKPQPGYSDYGIIPYPIKTICGKGEMSACNWGEVGQMLHYSGGMWYRKHVDITKEMLNGEVYINLGEVVATCEVHVNGTNSGIMISSPYRMNIGNLLKEGDNMIEVLVYSTLSNHYQTIPTPRHYRGDGRAGLIGPVKIETEDL